MRVLLLTAGSRGDVEPFAALARTALSAGHDVVLAAPDGAGVDLDGIDTISLGIDFSELVAQRGVSPLAAARGLRTRIRPGMQRMFTRAAQAVLEHRPDVVVHHPKVLTAAHAADAVGVPHVVVETVPTLSVTRAFPMPGVADRDLGPLNRSTYLAARAVRAMFAREVAAACRAAGLAPPGVPTPPALSLMPVSPHLLARPGDWPASVVMTGAWTTPGALAAPERVVSEFLTGPPFLYVGFGSMAAGDPEARGRTVVAAARAHGLRVLAATGWGGLRIPLDSHGPDVLGVTSVAHDAVLPHACVALHHGGAGTVHAAARAGVPQIVLPFTADQPFWARQLHERHLAPRPLNRHRLDAARLRQALHEAAACRETARRTAQAITAERGTHEALAVLEQVMVERGSTPPAHR